MKYVTSKDVQRNHSKILKHVYDNKEEVIVTLYGKPIAKIIPVDKEEDKHLFKDI